MNIHPLPPTNALYSYGPGRSTTEFYRPVGRSLMKTEDLVKKWGFMSEMLAFADIKIENSAIHDYLENILETYTRKISSVWVVGERWFSTVPRKIFSKNFQV